MKCNNCLNCGRQDNCSKMISVGMLEITDSDDVKELENIIKIYYLLPWFPVIVLIDNEKDIFFIYKATGNLEKFREETLPNLSKMYEMLKHTELVLSEIRDVRGVLRSNPVSVN